MRCEVRLAGIGGQGLITAGIILGEAALREGRQVVVSQSYGPEARGGASKAEVIIDNELIYYPKVSLPNILLVMSQQAFERFGVELVPGGTMIVDSSLVEVKRPVDGRLVEIPVTRLARERLRLVVANIVALGALAAVTGVVGQDSLRQAVLARVPKGTEALNLEALELGFKAGL